MLHVGRWTRPVRASSPSTRAPLSPSHPNQPQATPARAVACPTPAPSVLTKLRGLWGWTGQPTQTSGGGWSLMGPHKISYLGAGAALATHEAHQRKASPAPRSWQRNPRARCPGGGLRRPREQSATVGWGGEAGGLGSAAWTGCPRTPVSGTLYLLLSRCLEKVPLGTTWPQPSRDLVSLSLSVNSRSPS